MKVINKIEVGNAKYFSELNIGEAYLDAEKILCIKTGEVEDGYGACIACVNEEWQADEEYEDSKVIPVKVCLTILGYK